MDKNRAEHQARLLLAANGFDPDLFKWNRGKNLMGQMAATLHRDTGQVVINSISLSSYWVEAMTEDEVREVMLHEIAHAFHPRDKHGWRFKSKVRELGGTATDFCFAPSTETKARMEQLAPAPWVGTCPTCGQKRPMHRAPTAVKACSRCCRGRFNFRHVFEYTHNGRPVDPAKIGAKYARAYQASMVRHAFSRISSA